MAYFERMRETIAGPFDAEIVRQRMAAGWQLASIEWRRELTDSHAAQSEAAAEAIPFDLLLSADGKRLELRRPKASRT